MLVPVASFDPAALAERLRLAHTARGLSKRQVELQGGLSKGLFSRYTAPEGYGNIELPQLLKLAEILQVRVGWLATGEGAMDLGTAPDRYPALSAAVAYARLSDEFPDRDLLEHVVRVATGRVHDRGEGETSRTALEWLRELYAVEKHLRTVEGQRAELADREASAAAAASAPRATRDRFPARTKTAPKS